MSTPTAPVDARGDGKDRYVGFDDEGGYYDANGGYLDKYGAYTDENGQKYLHQQSPLRKWQKAAKRVMMTKRLVNIRTESFINQLEKMEEEHMQEVVEFEAVSAQKTQNTEYVV